MSMNQIPLQFWAEVCAEAGLMHDVREQEKDVAVLLPCSPPRLALLDSLEDRPVVRLVVPGLFTVPLERRAAIAEAAAHINFTTLVGAFSIDLRDGELRFMVGVPYGGSNLSLEQALQMLGMASWTLDTYCETLQRLCWTQESAAQAMGLTPELSPSQDPIAETPRSDDATTSAFLDQLLKQVGVEPELPAEEDPGDQKSA